MTNMKRTAALLLSLLLMLGTVLAAGEAEPAADNGELFRQGLTALLSSINLETDALNLTMTQPDQPDVGAAVQRVDGLTDVLVQTGKETVQAQFDSEQICLSAKGAVYQLKYLELLSSLQGADAAGSRELIQGVFQLFVMKVLAPHATVSHENGLRVSFNASGEELTGDLAGFVDILLADDKFEPLLARLLTVLGTVSGQSVPAFEELKAQWPQLRESMVQAGAGFAVSFLLDASPDWSRITVTGEAGTGADLLLMNWSYSNRDGEMTLTGNLTERITRSESVRDYDINLNASLKRLTDGFTWSADVRYPYRNFIFSAEGTHLGKSGQFRANLSSMSMRRYDGSVFGSYAVSDEGVIAQLSVVPRRTAPFVAQLTAARNKLDLTVTNYQGLKPFALELESDGRTLTHAVLLVEDQRRPVIRAEYDMEKLVVTQGSSVYTFTGEYVSGQNYVLSILIENGETAVGTSYVSVGFYGEPGNWRTDAAVTGPDGANAATFSFTCAPHVQDVQKLSEAEGLITLTPEMLLEMIPALIGQ